MKNSTYIVSGIRAGILGIIVSLAAWAGVNKNLMALFSSWIRAHVSYILTGVKSGFHSHGEVAAIACGKLSLLINWADWIALAGFFVMAFHAAFWLLVWMEKRAMKENK